jgi:hypothetical protein
MVKCSVLFEVRTKFILFRWALASKVNTSQPTNQRLPSTAYQFTPLLFPWIANGCLTMNELYISEHGEWSRSASTRVLQRNTTVSLYRPTVVATVVTFPHPQPCPIHHHLSWVSVDSNQHKFAIITISIISDRCKATHYTYVPVDWLWREIFFKRISLLVSDDHLSHQTQWSSG